MLNEHARQVRGIVATTPASLQLLSEAAAGGLTFVHRYIAPTRRVYLDQTFMTPSATRFRLAGISGGLGAAVGVLVFGTTTTQLLLASAGGFLVGAAIGLFLGTRIKSEALARADQLLKADVAARILISWGLVALGVAALVLRGWDVKIALVTLGFSIVALLCTFHRTVREGPDFERFRK